MMSPSITSNEEDDHDISGTWQEVGSESDSDEDEDSDDIGGYFVIADGEPQGVHGFLRSPQLTPP